MLGDDVHKPAAAPIGWRQGALAENAAPDGDRRPAEPEVESPARDLRAMVARQFGRMRWQLAAGVLLGVFLPAVLTLTFAGFTIDNSFLGTLWAMLFGYVIFRKVTAFPGVRATAYILPAFVASYAVAALVFAALRIEFSRYQFLYSLAFSIVTFYAIFFVAQRVRKLELDVIPGGDVARLRELADVRWRYLATPETAPDGARAKIPVVADLRSELSPAWDRFIADSALAGRPVYNAKQIHESLSGRVQIEHLSENPFGTLAPNSIYASLKHHGDWLLAAALLVLASPVFLAVALLIRLDSKGPALFRQLRMGQGGRPFTVYKFRTMREERPGAGSEAGEASLSEQMTKNQDSRITRVGRILRWTRIDEFPQIINILRNEMSWIGPRPEAIMLSRWYEAQIPFYRYRHVVRPGITGWAQVNQGHVTKLDDIDRKLQYDFFYVKNLSLWLDILVVLQTIRVMTTGHGAK